MFSRDRIHGYDQIPAAAPGPPDLDKPDWDTDLCARPGLTPA